MTSFVRLRSLVGLTLVALLALGACGGSDAVDPNAERAVQQFAGLEETILGETIVYPTEGQAQFTSTVLTLQPGEQTGWHHHDAPLYAYILEGSLTVDYGDQGTRTYLAGEALLEAIGTSHNGMAHPDTGVEILVLNIGADGVENTVSDG